MPVELDADSRFTTPQEALRSQSVFLGTAASPGVAIGGLFAPAAMCPLVAVPDQPASDPQAELRLLEGALGALRRELSALEADQVPVELNSLSGVYQVAPVDRPWPMA